MANIHAITDEIIRSRVGLVIALNALHKEDPEMAYQKYLISLQEIQNHFAGSKPIESNDPDEPVEEKGDIG